jgi:hypothetical protein
VSVGQLGIYNSGGQSVGGTELYISEPFEENKLLKLIAICNGSVQVVLLSSSTIGLLLFCQM